MAIETNPVCLGSREAFAEKLREKTKSLCGVKYEEIFVDENLEKAVVTCYDEKCMHVMN